MKKKWMTWLLTLAVMLSVLTVPAAANTTDFSDVSDRGTATAVEVLRLMGVLDGYGDGTFRPDVQLNRAQFCKMAVYAMDGSDELGKYQAITIFPDVKPSHWASTYINMAARGAKVIAGYPDGKFHPERTVTAGQAVTILLRLLGYTDEEVGGVWPDSQMALARSIDLTEGTGIAGGHAPLTRAQAARLFVNLLRAEYKDGGGYYQLSEETTLISMDGGDGTLTTADQKTYDMVQGAAASSLVGSRGQVVLNEKGEALTFLPVASGTGSVSSGAVVLYADRSTAGLSALTGGSTYDLYKNGSPASVGDLRKYDVAVWNGANQTVRVTDTRVTALYENCSPGPEAPAVIEILGGTKFNVLPTAQDSLSDFKPGEVVTFLLTADGQVAAAVDPDGGGARGNAVGIVSDSGQIQMLCGTGLIPVAAAADASCYGQAIRLSSGKKGMSFTVLKNEISGTLDLSGRKLGGRSLAENVLVLDQGQLTGLSQVTQDLSDKDQILYVRTNWKNQVDLIVLNQTAGEVFGRVFWETESYDEDGTAQKRIGVEFDGQRVGPFRMEYDFQTGDYVAAKLNRNGTGFASLVELTQLKGVSRSAWIGDEAVTVNGKTYTVPESVLCYNRDNQSWITLEEALAYSGSANLHVRNGVVRIVEVKS